jgi:hypothetical protein
MARSISVALLKYAHVVDGSDGIIFMIPCQKNDQEGDNTTFSKHLYCNPDNPLVCPILALALWVFSRPYIPEESQSVGVCVFDGAAEKRFSEWLTQRMKLLAQDGNHWARDIGTHSFRKGAATYCLGFPQCPDWISVFLRAGWSLGKVQDKYIHGGDGGDQYAGRVSAGLDYTSPRFGILQPHFKSNESGI